MALEHGQGPQPCSSGYLKRHIFRDPYPCNGSNKPAPFTPIWLKPAGSSDSVLILPTDISQTRLPLTMSSCNWGRDMASLFLKYKCTGRATCLALPRASIRTD